MIDLMMVIVVLIGVTVAIVVHHFLVQYLG